MKVKDSKITLSDQTLALIKNHKSPIEGAIGELLNATSGTGKKYMMSKALLLLMVEPVDAQVFSAYHHGHDSVAEAQAQKLKNDQSFLLSNPVDDFVNVYQGLYPFLISPKYSAHELVSLVINLLKEMPVDERLVFAGISLRELTQWMVLILAMEYGYSRDFTVIKNWQTVFGMTGLHREYWLYDLTETLYPLIKDRITLTPNLHHVFKYDRYASNVKELYGIWDEIPFDARDDEFTLPSGTVIRPSEYMLKKTKKTADAGFFMREIMDRFAYINHLAYEKWDYYLLAPPLVELLKCERTSSRWHGAHSHIFTTPDDDAIRHKIMHIGDQYYAQRLIGTPLCDHCSRIYALSPKHTTHIMDLHYPTLNELQTIHQNNLNIGMYVGL